MHPYGLLCLAAAAVLAVWLPERWRHAAALSASTLLAAGGLLAGVLEPLALAWLTALFASAWWAGGERPGRAFGRALFILLALGIGFGLLPGFSPVTLSAAESLKPGARPYSLQFGLGKPLVAVALLLWLVPVARSGWDTVLRRAAPLVAATPILVSLLAWGAGFIRPAPGLPPLTLTLGWIAVNLLLVCTVEEGFFRGLVQEGLGRRLAPPLAIGLAALLFGLAHFAGGALYVLLAAAAGLGYGLAYHRAGQRIEAAILAHFAVNFSHFALFTYPGV